MSHLIAFLSTFCAVFLKGMQHKNIMAHDLKAIAITSYMMSVTDVILIGVIVDKGLVIAFAGGTGAALRMVLSIRFHSEIMKALGRLTGRKRRDGAT